MIKWQKLPFGFLIENNELRRTAWDMNIGTSLIRLRFVEWPWSDWQLQLYIKGKMRVLAHHHYKQKVKR